MATTKYPHVNTFMQRFVTHDNSQGGSVKLNGRTPEEVWDDESAMQLTDDYLAKCSQDSINALIVGSTDEPIMPEEVTDCINSIMQILWDEAVQADGKMIDGLDSIIRALNIKPDPNQYAALVGLMRRIYLDASH